ncbi:MAG: uracil-DNA glycosylase [Candidatus Dojkabacteria bacterium]
MDVKIHKSWKKLLGDEFDKPYFEELVGWVKQEYQATRIFPAPSAIFRAFDLTPVDDVKVVILGQDPYHKVSGYNADGLAFSVKDEHQIPPSLRNIFKELEADTGKEAPDSGNLENWAKQGVLLLNATLTVRAGEAGSHQGRGWEGFTDAVIRKLADEKENLVFILWGSYARNKGEFIDREKHLVIESPHPSPFSADRGFFGSKPFSKTNHYLRRRGIMEIDW